MRRAATRREGPFTVITASRPLSPAPSPQANREAERAIERRRRNAAHYAAMLAILQRLVPTGHAVDIRRLAVKISEVKGVELDRGARRLKECLICWFCEHCPELLQGHNARDEKDASDSLDSKQFDAAETWRDDSFEWSDGFPE